MLGADGQIDTIEGTTLLPIWSVDRDDWVPLGELQEGEQLLSSLPSPHLGRGIEGEGQTATILAHQVIHRTTTVYNIEVHGEHVYQVGTLGILVHNTCEVLVSRWGRDGLKHGDWVMKGGATKWNYWRSFKWEPPIMSNNIPAAFKTGREYVVKASDVVWPKGWGRDGWWKGLFGQRIYVGAGL